MMPQPNIWYHVAAVASRTGSTALYINGVAEATASGNMANLDTTQPLFIGAENSGGNPGNFWNGFLDDLRIYHRALSLSEIQALANPTTPTPTPSPTPCTLYTPTSQIPSGFGSPFDVVSAPTTNLMNVTCDISSAKVDLGNGNPMQYIYTTGYLFKLNATNWTPISYTSTEPLVSGAWYPKSANTTIPLTSQELQNTSYVLGYLCTWTGAQWKCGCRDSACTQSYW